MDFDGSQVFSRDGSSAIRLKDIGNRVMCNNGKALEVTTSHSSPVSPPPFMVGMAEIEMDMETYEYELIDFVAVVDCGTPINPNLVRVQTEGGLGQGIGMAMFEDVTRSQKGRVFENSFMQYKLPTRMDAVSYTHLDVYKRQKVNSRRNLSVFSYIKGPLVEVWEGGIVVEAGGIGWNILVPLSVLDRLPRIGEELKIYTSFQVRELSLIHI